MKGLRGYCLISVGIFCHFFHSIDDELGIAHQPTGINDINLVVLNCFDMTESGVFVNLPGRHGIYLAVFLGNGELTKALEVRAQGFTKSAQQKIEAAGGKVEVI